MAAPEAMKTTPSKKQLLLYKPQIQMQLETASKRLWKI
jgi:hypothetical protein